MALYWIAQVDVPAALSLFGFALVTTPLFWHLRTWNTGCILYIFWIGGLCLTNGINILLWRENAINFAPAWCDIYIRFYVASSVGVVSSSLVTTRRLYNIANMTAATTDSSRARRRHNVVTDLLIGLGIPLLTIALYWFYQGHRFDILEGVGCVEATRNTFLLILLNTAWSLAIGLVSACYAVLTLRGALHRTKDLKQLQIVEPGLTTSRYYRLMALAAAELCFTTAFTMYVLMYNIRVVGLYPYKGLADLHYDFGRVDSVAAILWRQDALAVSVMNFRIWTPIGCAYKLAFTWVARRAGVSLFEDTPRPVADSDLWDDFRVNVFSANRAEFYGGVGTPRRRVGRARPVWATGVSG